MTSQHKFIYFKSLFLAVDLKPYW